MVRRLGHHSAQRSRNAVTQVLGSAVLPTSLWEPVCCVLVPLHKQSCLQVPPSTKQGGNFTHFKRAHLSTSLWGQQYVIALAGMADSLGVVRISWQSPEWQSSHAWKYEPVVVVLVRNFRNMTIM